MPPQKEALAKSISAIIANGNQLLGDAKLLFDFERYSTSLALSILAQEEFAKAFLLQLVLDDVLPWLTEIQRSMARHQCKHLLSIVMEWLPPFNLEEIEKLNIQNQARHEKRMAWLQRRTDRYKRGDILLDADDPEPVDDEFAFPPDVAAALNIYRHEEIERFRSGIPWKDTDWATGKARKIADGALDRKKQSAFYVDITKTGEIGLRPELITREEAIEAIGQAERFSDTPITFSNEYKRLKEALALIFSGLKDDATE